MNVHRDALLLVPQWQCISSFVFYILVSSRCGTLILWITLRMRRVRWSLAERRYRPMDMKLGGTPSHLWRKLLTHLSIACNIYVGISYRITTSICTVHCTDMSRLYLPWRPFLSVIMSYWRNRSSTLFLFLLSPKELSNYFPRYWIWFCTIDEKKGRDLTKSCDKALTPTEKLNAKASIPSKNERVKIQNEGNW